MSKTYPKELNKSETIQQHHIVLFLDLREQSLLNIKKKI